MKPRRYRAWSVARYPRYNCREFLSLSLFSVPFYQKETQMFARPSLLQFNRDETCPDCKLSGYSVAGLNAYDCSPLIARLVNSRTNGLEMREISISQFCPQNGMFCEIVDTFVLLFWKIFQNIYIYTRIHKWYLKIISSSLRTVWPYAGSFHCAFSRFWERNVDRTCRCCQIVQDFAVCTRNGHVLFNRRRVTSFLSICPFATTILRLSEHKRSESTCCSTVFTRLWIQSHPLLLYFFGQNRFIHVLFIHELIVSRDSTCLPIPFYIDLHPIEWKIKFSRLIFILAFWSENWTHHTR